MPCEQLVGALEARLQDVLAEGVSNAAAAPKAVRTVANLVLTAELLRSALGRTAWVVCKREWLGTEGQQYVATWALGLRLLCDGGASDPGRSTATLS